MKVVDANVLLSAVNTSAEHYQDAHDWLDDALNGDEVIGLPWLVIVAFIRISTLPHGFPQPLMFGGIAVCARMASLAQRGRSQCSLN